MELPVNKTIINIAILVSFALILIRILNDPVLQNTYNAAAVDHMNMSENEESSCDIFTGEWVPDPDAPYYTNKTCWAIHEHQNCMKHGRPDSNFLKWKWKPDGCDLPAFSPGQFLRMVRNKTMAFVGDSVGRNQMQSIICLLSKVSTI
ncbi:hypothetical protein SASPL_142313 [Salvia splendens]|uniref:Trichome birefringence-like N-terminal domain-containing protein n=1 Tax=Salvia splendens TaxID=180675 RepID=A0A8X8WK36_SALSN|nr:hypothetical protein SASPL_142313 [Salvia splendens]